MGAPTRPAGPPRVALIDYGGGNLHSVHKALEAAGLQVCRTADPVRAGDADALVLPGQGHFGQVMGSFLASGFEPLVRDHIEAGRPFLGICVGLQLLARSSEEAPGIAGLGLLPAEVRRFSDPSVSVPQMGWNQIEPRADPALLAGIPDGSFFYFANSFYLALDPEAETDVVGAVTRYGRTAFLSAFSLGGVHATQFHPEKSQRLGLRVLANFRRLLEAA